MGLHGPHHVGRLVVVGIAEGDRPLLTAGKHLEDLRKLRQRLHTGIPRHLVYGSRQLLRRLVAVLLHPAFGFLHLLRISRRSKCLRDERVGIKGYRRNQLLQFLRALRDVRSLAATVLRKGTLLARIAGILVRILLLGRRSILRHQAELRQRHNRCTDTQGNALPQGALP